MRLDSSPVAKEERDCGKQNVRRNLALNYEQSGRIQSPRDLPWPLGFVLFMTGVRKIFWVFKVYQMKIKKTSKF